MMLITIVTINKEERNVHQQHLLLWEGYIRWWTKTLVSTPSLLNLGKSSWMSLNGLE